MNSEMMVTPSLDISVRVRGGITIAELAGELDIASAPALRERLLGLLQAGSSQLVIDLSQVSFRDASGLAVLVSTSRRARLLGGFLRVTAVSPQADRVLHITGLHRHLAIFPTVRAGATDLPGARRSRTDEAAASTQPAPGTPWAGNQACRQARAVGTR
jgi:anti-sigma B factor antagonist